MLRILSYDYAIIGIPVVLTAFRLALFVSIYSLTPYSVLADQLEAQEVQVLATSNNLAQATDPNGATGNEPDVTLRNVIKKVLQNNPRLRGNDIDIAILDARREQADQRPGYEIEAELEDVFTTGRPDFVDSWQATIRLGTVLELGQKRERRTSVVIRERERLDVLLQAQQLDVISQAARTFVEALSAQERTLLAQQQVENYTVWASRIKERVKAGSAGALEESNSRLRLVQARLDRRQAELVRQRARTILVSYWQGHPSDMGVLLGNFYEIPPIPELSDLQRMVSQNPDLVLFMSDERIRDAEYQLTRAGSTPDINVSAGVRRLQPNRSFGLVFSASIPFATGPRNRPFEREAEGHVRRTQIDLATKRWELESTLAEMHVRLTTAKETYTTLSELALPEARKAVSIAEEGYERARYSFQELSLAQEQLIQIQYAILEAATEYHLIFLELERLTGQSMTSLASSS